MSFRTIDLYYDLSRGNIVNPINGSPTGSVGIPVISYRETVVLRLRLVYRDSNEALQAYTSFPGDAFLAVIDNDFSSATNPLVPDSFITINDLADWSEADPTKGWFSLRIDADNSYFKARIGVTAKLYNTVLELTGWSADYLDLLAALRFTFHCAGLMYKGGTVPPTPVGDYYTRLQSDARFVRGLTGISVIDDDEAFVIITLPEGSTEPDGITGVVVRPEGGVVGLAVTGCGFINIPAGTWRVYLSASPGVSGYQLVWTATYATE